MKLTRPDALLSPDEPTAGDTTAQQDIEAAAEQAGTEEGSGGAGDNPSGSDANDDPAAQDLSAAFDKIVEDAQPETDKPKGATKSPKGETDQPAGETDAQDDETGETLEPISDEDIREATMQVALTGTQASPSDEDEVKPGNIAASAKARQEAKKADPKGETKDEAAETPRAIDEAKVKKVIEEVPEVAEALAELLEANKALQARLDRQDAERKAAAEQATKAQADAAERQAIFDKEVAPILNAIDRIPNLDEARYGRFNGSRDKAAMTPAQYEARVELDNAAGRLEARWKSIGKKNPDGTPLTKAQIYDAAHRSLMPKKPDTKAIKNQVVKDLQKQHKSRTAAGLAKSPSTTREAAVFTEKDTGPQAMEKAFAAATGGN